MKYIALAVGVILTIMPTSTFSNTNQPAQSSVTKRDKAQFCRVVLQCRVAASNPSGWILCMKSRGFQVKAGDGYKVCGK